ncbi:MAG TPA: hypothetical protein VHZ56_04700 [Devosia sp.]|nr:hypothetical protein [Devosia sp.]
MGTPDSRAAAAQALRDEARAFLSQTGLFALLQAQFGDPTVTGSAGYDLMVWRDIDIHLPLEPERWPEWMAFGGRLAELFDAIGLGLHKASYLNAYVEPHPQGAGLCWSLDARDFAGNPWQVDIWGWDPFDYAVRQARDFSLRTDLRAADRDLILRLKTEARARDNYHGVKVSSWDIYRFAIARAGDSLGALEQWKRTQ